MYQIENEVCRISVKKHGSELCGMYDKISCMSTYGRPVRSGRNIVRFYSLPSAGFMTEHIQQTEEHIR